MTRKGRHKKREWSTIPSNMVTFSLVPTNKCLASAQTSNLIFDLPFLPSSILDIIEECLGVNYSIPYGDDTELFHPKELLAWIHERRIPRWVQRGSDFIPFEKTEPEVYSDEESSSVELAISSSFDL